MKKWVWIGVALLALIVVFVIQDRAAYSNARSEALEKCASDFDQQFGGNHEANLADCEARFEDAGY